MSSKVEREKKRWTLAPFWLCLPAWLISLAVHLAVLISGALLIAVQRPVIGSAQTERRVSVVLAPRTAEPTNYFAVDDNRDSVMSQQLAAETAGSRGIAVTTDPPPLLPGIALPQLPGAVPPGEGIVGVAAPGLPGKRASLLPGQGDAEAIAADQAIPREAEPTGPTATLSLFGSSAAEGRSFVFVIDRSASMGGSGLGAIHAAAVELQKQLTSLDGEQMFQVVAYNQSAVYFMEGLAPATEPNKQRLVKFLEDLAAYGQTEHTRGLLAAARLKPEVIFLLTDGGDPVMTLAQLHTVRDATRGRASIHCLHFGRGQPVQGESFLKRLAAENRGSYTYIDMNAR
jgi:Ca-activated chloride channel family protein